MEQKMKSGLDEPGDNDRETVLEDDATRVAVRGHWLQFMGMMTGTAGLWNGLDNAARTITRPPRPAELRVQSAFMVAT